MLGASSAQCPPPGSSGSTSPILSQYGTQYLLSTYGTPTAMITHRVCFGFILRELDPPEDAGMVDLSLPSFSASSLPFCLESPLRESDEPHKQNISQGGSLHWQGGMKEQCFSVSSSDAIHELKREKRHFPFMKVDGGPVQLLMMAGWDWGKPETQDSPSRYICIYLYTTKIQRHPFSLSPLFVNKPILDACGFIQSSFLCK